MGESSLWFDRFELYRRMGPSRSLGGSVPHINGDIRARQLHLPYVNVGDLEGIAELYRWRWRAEAWDDDVRQDMLSEERRVLLRMKRRHVRIAMQMQLLGFRRLRMMSKTNQAAVELSPADARQYVNVGIQIERQAMGLSNAALDLQELTDEQLLAKHRQLTERVGSLRSGSEAPESEGSQSSG